MQHEVIGEVLQPLQLDKLRLQLPLAFTTNLLIITGTRMTTLMLLAIFLLSIPRALVATDGTAFEQDSGTEIPVTQAKFGQQSGTGGARRHRLLDSLD